MESGQVLTMQVDMDAGTLKFWLDGKPHGPGYTSRVTGPLRWVATDYYTGNSVEIVPTPELQWTARELPEEGDCWLLNSKTSTPPCSMAVLIANFVL